MIKRNGVEIKPSKEIRTNNKAARDVLEILNNKYYIVNNTKIDISKEIDYSVNNSKYYPNPVSVNYNVISNPTLEVVNEKTTQSATRLLLLGKTNLVALNFASAISPGGGWLYGAKGQEEDLVRCSALYSSLKINTKYYWYNNTAADKYYSHDIIYSPDVIFFKNDNLDLLENPYKLSVITCPAPNINNLEKINYKKLNDILKERIEKIINVAINNNHKNIILGAWGCGAFGNDPEMIASLFLDCISNIAAFEHICFAVFDNKPEKVIFNTFKQIIK